MPLEDLRELYGLDVTELALYDTLEAHVAEQAARGRMVLVEVDAFGLPDTRGVSYRLEHAKTTIAVNRIDPDAAEPRLFPQAGLLQLAWRGLRDGAGHRQRPAALFPYAEFVKFDALRAHADPASRCPPAPAPRPAAGRQPGSRLSRPAARAGRRRSEREPAFLHSYAFNTARQLGMNFELLGSHLAWLAAAALPDLRLQRQRAKSCPAAPRASSSSSPAPWRASASTPSRPPLDPLVAAYDRVFEPLCALQAGREMA